MSDFVSKGQKKKEGRSVLMLLYTVHHMACDFAG